MGRSNRGRTKRVRRHYATSARSLIGRFGRMTKGARSDYGKALARIDRLYWASRSVKRSRVRKKNPLTRRETAILLREAKHNARRGTEYWYGASDAQFDIAAHMGVARGVRRRRVRKKNPLLQVVMPNRRRRARRKNPSVLDGGAFVSVTMSAREVAAFKRSWPASGLPDRAITFEFDKSNGDLVDLRPRSVDGSAAVALSEDAWAHYESTKKNPPIRGYAARGGARVRGGQRISRVGFVSASEARTYPGFAKALALHRSFHGRAPTHFTRLRIEDGQQHVDRKAVVLIGEAPAIEYRTWRYQNSAKSHTKDGRRIVWRHKLGERGGKPAYWVHDPVSGVTSLVGGTYKVAGKPAFYHH